MITANKEVLPQVNEFNQGSVAVIFKTIKKTSGKNDLISPLASFTSFAPLIRTMVHFLYLHSRLDAVEWTFYYPKIARKS